MNMNGGESCRMSVDECNLVTIYLRMVIPQKGLLIID